jgi:hypothetical protein
LEKKNSEKIFVTGIFLWGASIKPWFLDKPETEGENRPPFALEWE